MWPTGWKNVWVVLCLTIASVLIAGGAGAAGAQPAPTTDTTTVDVDMAAFRVALEERLAFAASSPLASARSLRRMALQLAREQIETRRKNRQAAAAPEASSLDPEAARRQRMAEQRLERRMRRMAIRRAEARAQQLHPRAPLPPEKDPQGLTRPRPRAALPSATGGITGNVSGPSGPVWAWLDLYDSSGDYYYGTSTDASGDYALTGLPTGTYYVKTETYDGLIDEAWNNVPCPYGRDAKACGGTPIAVTDGVTTSGINFVLAAGGQVAGIVTAAATSSPITGVYVYVYDSSGTMAAYSYTGAAGDYTSYQGLPSGTYFARTNNAGSQGYLDEAYDNIPCAPTCTVTAATPITVTSPSTTSGIDFALDLGGTISGTVTAEGTALPISGAYVQVYRSTDGTASYAGQGVTGADGTYSVGGLVAGNYYVRTWNSSGYIDELYDDISCGSYCSIASGDPIAVTLGMTTSGIDFALVLGGTIAGKVTRSDTGADIAGMEVDIYDSSGSYVSYGYTDASGNYAAGGLTTGGYFAVTSTAWTGLNFIDEAYDDVPCVGSSYYGGCDVQQYGTRISVTLGATTSGIDFALAPGGGFSGMLTNAATSAPISAWMEVYNQAGSFVLETWPYGSYSVVGLPSGTFYVWTMSLSGVIAELYDDIPCLSCDPLRGDPIVVTAGSITPGIDIALSPGARVSGTVTRADTGGPLADAEVDIWHETGSYVGYSYGYSDSSGQYTTALGFPSGTYFAFAYPPYSERNTLARQLYKGIDCLSAYADCNVAAGDPIVLTAPNTKAGIDFALSTGGSIAGVVTDAGSGVGIPNLYVYARAVTGSGSSASQYTTTAGDGAYTLSGLPPGRYYVVTSNYSSEYVDEVYDDISCLGCDVRAGQSVEVRSGSMTSGIDFALAKGGMITGTVTSAASGLGLGGGVYAYSSAGAYVRSASIASGSGAYAFSGLPTGTYYLVTRTQMGYIEELYDNLPCPLSSCEPTGGTAVSVTAGSTTSGIDFALSAGGTITGYVTDASGLGAFGGEVWAYSSSGAPAGNTWVLANGLYRIWGLPADNYYVVAYGNGGLIPEAYDDVPCLGCNPVTSGTAVPLSAGGTASGIDFTLGLGGRISGTVATAFGVPIRGAAVGVFDASGTLLGYTYTDTQGAYLTSEVGLPAGTYYAMAQAVGFDSQLYSSLSCGSACDPTAGTPITVSGSGTVPGVDFSLVGESLDFYTLGPCRLLDTRNATGLLGGPALSFRSDRNFPVAGVCGVPPDAKSLSVNLTVTQAQTQGHVRLHPGRSRIPPSSTLNYTVGVTRANNAVIPLSAVGELAIYCAQASGTAHVIVDVNGYFK